MRLTPDAEAEARSRQWGMRQNETVFQNIAVQSRTNRPGLANEPGVSYRLGSVSPMCRERLTGVTFTSVLFRQETFA